MVEFLILIIFGIVGTILGFQIPFSPFTNVLGFILLILGCYVHWKAHRVHKKAHESIEKIDKIVRDGMYSKVRHPCYLGLILIYLGVPFVWGCSLVLVPSFVFIVLTVLTAIEEEKALLEKFGKEYEEYMKKVKWRFIPGVF
jgi:protein-S-isoprenylcysteine O-methyltransferase Ste14